MTDLELIFKGQKQQDDFINMLRFKIEALEAVLKNHVPNFEEQLVKERFRAENRQAERMQETHDRQND